MSNLKSESTKPAKLAQSSSEKRDTLSAVFNETRNKIHEELEGSVEAYNESLELLNNLLDRMKNENNPIDYGSAEIENVNYEDDNIIISNAKDNCYVNCLTVQRQSEFIKILNRKIRYLTNEIEMLMP